MVSSVKKIAVANTLGYFVGIVVAFVQAPFLIHLLGDERYGLWTLIGLMTGYYGLLDFGVRGGVGYFIARARATDDGQALREVASSATVFLLAVSGVVALSALVAIPLFLSHFGVSSDHRAESERALWIAVSTLCLSLPLDVFSAIISGSRRNEIVAVAETVTRLTVMSAIFVVLPNHPGLDALATINLCGKAIVWLVAAVAARRIEPRAVIRFGAVRVARVREVLGYGVKSFMSNIAGTLIERLDTVVIAGALGPARVTTYVVGQQLSSYIGGLVNAITLALTPFFADLAARDDHGEAKRLLVDGTRVSSLAALFISAGLLGFGSVFIDLWVGDRFTGGALLNRADVVLVILAIGYLPRFIFSAGHQYLFGIRRHGFLAKALMAEGVANILLSLVLVRWWGLAGVAIATLIPSVIVHAIVLPRFIAGSASMRTAELYRLGVAGSLPPAMAVCAIGLVAHIAGIHAWPTFFASVALASIVGLLCAWRFTLTDSERGRVRTALRPSPGH